MDGVLVDGGDAQPLAVLLVECGDTVHAAGEHLLQALYRGARGQDETQLLLTCRALLFQRLVVEPVKEPAQCRGLGRLIAQTAFEAGVGGEKVHVIGAVATDGLQHQDGLDHLVFAEAAAALAQLQMVRDQFREAKGAVYAGGGKSAGVRAGGFPEGQFSCRKGISS